MPHQTTLVTGATGALGKRFVCACEKRGLGVALYTDDITDGKRLREFVMETQPSEVVHLAAVVDISKVNSNEQYAFEVNSAGTLNLLKAVEAANLRPWLFYASSSHVYGHVAGDIDETAPVRPANFYAETKYIGERIARFYAHRLDVPVCIGRIFSLYDMEQGGDFLVPSMMRRMEASAGEAVVVANGDSIRDFSSAADVSEKIHQLMDRRYSGTVNIASGVGKTVVGFLNQLFPDFGRFVADPNGSVTSITADISKFKDEMAKL